MYDEVCEDKRDFRRIHSPSSFSEGIACHSPSKNSKRERETFLDLFFSFPLIVLTGRKIQRWFAYSKERQFIIIWTIQVRDFG